MSLSAKDLALRLAKINHLHKPAGKVMPPSAPVGVYATLPDAQQAELKKNMPEEIEKKIDWTLKFHEDQKDRHFFVTRNSTQETGNAPLILFNSGLYDPNDNEKIKKYNDIVNYLTDQPGFVDPVRNNRNYAEYVISPFAIWSADQLNWSNNKETTEDAEQERQKAVTWLRLHCKHELPDDHAAVRRILNPVDPWDPQHAQSAIYNYSADDDPRRPPLRVDMRSVFEGTTTPIQSRWYQERSVDRVTHAGRARNGVLLLPCGSGKTFTGIKVLVEMQRSTIIVCNSVVSCNQWRNELLKYTTLRPKDIIIWETELSDETREKDKWPDDVSTGMTARRDAEKLSPDPDTRHNQLKAKIDAQEMSKLDAAELDRDYSRVGGLAYPPLVLITTYTMLQQAQPSKDQQDNGKKTGFQQKEGKDNFDIWKKVKGGESVWHRWGLMLLDEVQEAKAKVRSESIRQILEGSNGGHGKPCVVGLTATLLFADEKAADVGKFFADKPVLYQADWLQIQRQGYIATVKCHEITVPSVDNSKPFREALEKLTAWGKTYKPGPIEKYYDPGFVRRYVLWALNPNKIRFVEGLVHAKENAHPRNRILIFCDHRLVIQRYAELLGRPFMFGDTPLTERNRLMRDFKRGFEWQYNSEGGPLTLDPEDEGFNETDYKLNDELQHENGRPKYQKCKPLRTLLLSRVGDTSLDLPDANVGIQIQGQFGSQRQETQRMGRVLRKKNLVDTLAPNTADFYTVISDNSARLPEKMFKRDPFKEFPDLIDEWKDREIVSKEREMAARRSSFLLEQGYYYEANSVTEGQIRKQIEDEVPERDLKVRWLAENKTFAQKNPAHVRVLEKVSAIDAPDLNDVPRYFKSLSGDIWPPEKQIAREILAENIKKLTDDREDLQIIMEYQSNEESKRKRE